MSGPADPVVIGIVAAPHGVRGAIKVREVGSGNHLRAGMEPLICGERRRILAVRQTGKGYLLDLEGLESREDAVAVRGAELVLGRGELDELPDGEFYLGDLIGLRAEDGDGNTVGHVEDVLENPGNEVLVICAPETEPLYVPFTTVHVPKVDLSGGAVVVEPPRE